VYADEIKILKQERVITVEGRGEMDVQPDSFNFEFVVESEGIRLKSAHQENAHKISQITDAIKRLNIPNVEFATKRFNFSFGEGKFLDKRKVQNTVLVRAEGIAYEDLGIFAASCIDEAVSNGATRVYGLTFYLKDEDSAKNKVLKLAVQDAREKASIVAKELGVLIKEPNKLSTSFQSTSAPILYREREAYMAESVATPISPGWETVVAEVQAEFKF
jgi:uncharacterized protein YggE